MSNPYASAATPPPVAPEEALPAVDLLEMARTTAAVAALSAAAGWVASLVAWVLLPAPPLWLVVPLTSATVVPALWAGRSMGAWPAALAGGIGVAAGFSVAGGSALALAAQAPVWLAYTAPEPVGVEACTAAATSGTVFAELLGLCLVALAGAAVAAATSLTRGRPTQGMVVHILPAFVGAHALLAAMVIGTSGSALGESLRQSTGSAAPALWLSAYALGCLFVASAAASWGLGQAVRTWHLASGAVHAVALPLAWLTAYVLQHNDGLAVGAMGVLAGALFALRAPASPAAGSWREILGEGLLLGLIGCAALGFEGVGMGLSLSIGTIGSLTVCTSGYTGVGPGPAELGLQIIGMRGVAVGGLLAGLVAALVGTAPVALVARATASRA